MKLNKKGVTLVEIIISIALISLVLIFLFSLLINTNELNKKNDINSTYLITKALIIKNIEEDIKDSVNFKVHSCEIKDFFERYNTYKNDLDNNKKVNICMKFSFQDRNNNQNISYLGIYYYQKPSGNSDNSYVISYINELKNIRATRNLPEFEKYNVSDNNYIYKDKIKIGNLKYNELNLSGNFIQNGYDSTIIEIPILGPENQDYTIILPYSPNP